MKPAPETCVNDGGKKDAEAESKETAVADNNNSQTLSKYQASRIPGERNKRNVVRWSVGRHGG